MYVCVRERAKDGGVIYDVGWLWGVRWWVQVCSMVERELRCVIGVLMCLVWQFATRVLHHLMEARATAQRQWPVGHRASQCAILGTLCRGHRTALWGC